MTKKKKNGSYHGIMNMHHITKSLFVGAAIAGIGMSSGKAELTFNEEFRESVKDIVRKTLKEKYKAFDAIFPGTLSDIQLEQDTNTVCHSLFDRDSGFAHFFTDDFRSTHQTLSDFSRLYAYPKETLNAWLGHVFGVDVLTGGVDLPDNVEFQNNRTLHIKTALLSLVERINMRQIGGDKVTASKNNDLITTYYCNGGNGWCISLGGVVDAMSSEIVTLWYPYVLAHPNDNETQRARYEIAEMLCFCEPHGEFPKAFFVSLTKNYSRYLTIKGDLQNNRFTSGTYQMYTRFKESNERIRRMVVLERCSSKTGSEGDGILDFLNFHTLDFLGCGMDKVWKNMVIKFKEMESFTKFVETHPRYKKFICRRLMRIWADSDNR